MRIVSVKVPRLGHVPLLRPRGHGRVDAENVFDAAPGQLGQRDFPGLAQSLGPGVNLVRQLDLSACHAITLIAGTVTSPWWHEVCTSDQNQRLAHAALPAASRRPLFSLSASRIEGGGAGWCRIGRCRGGFTRGDGWPPRGEKHENAHADEESGQAEDGLLSPRTSWSVFTLPTDFCSNGGECVWAAGLFRGGSFPTRQACARLQSRQFSATTLEYHFALNFGVRFCVAKSQCTIPNRMS